MGHSGKLRSYGEKNKMKEEKKVVISTFVDWTSYGSVLQAVGLQYILKKTGILPKTIVYKNIMDKSPIKKPRMLNVPGYIVYRYKMLHKNEFMLCKKRGLAFIDEHLDIEMYESYEDLKRKPPVADVYISGSDQVWNPLVCREDFFLNYAPNEKKRISYAASMGVLQIPKNKNSDFQRQIRNFDAISIREQDTTNVIQKYTDVELTRNIDPSFLIPRAVWKEFENSYDIRKPFILVYAIFWDKKYNRDLIRLHKKTGWDIVCIQNSYRNIYANRRLFDVGPAEFIWLIDKAEAVITSSFHGCAFSLIFNKMFTPIINPDAPSRIENLLNEFEIHSIPEIVDVTSFEYDYEAINKHINAERDRSVSYLTREIIDEE